VLSESDQHQVVHMSTRAGRSPVKFSKDFFINKHRVGIFKYNNKISSSIQIFHQNVQSLNNKKLNIDVLLTDKALELDVLCITERWLGENEIDYYNFRNYSRLSRNFVGKINSLEVHVFMLKQI
jgi:hypothetical protein